MEPKTNEDWIAEYNKAIDQGFDVPSSWLRTLLTTRDAERDKAVEAARRKVHLAEFLPGHVYALPIEQITSTQAAQIGMMASCRIVLLPTECFNLALSPKDPLSTDQVTEK